LNNGLLHVRAAFKAKGNAAAIQDLILWSEKIAGLGRETKRSSFLYRNVPSGVNDELRNQR
jgi:hypothetical protein